VVSPCRWLLSRLASLRQCPRPHPSCPLHHMHEEEEDRKKLIWSSFLVPGAKVPETNFLEFGLSWFVIPAGFPLHKCFPIRFRGTSYILHPE
jgi:hypothetical protein